MGKYKFSIVVPVYQAEAFLKECIESVIEQEESSWELILVDDGSTDKSPEICDSYASRNSGIRVIHKKNEGPLLARYCGFCQAKGEYIINLDADDRLKRTALKTVEKILEKNSYDMIIFNYCRINRKGEKTGKRSNLTKEYFNKENKGLLFQKLWKENCLNSLCNKVFPRKYIKDMLPQKKSLQTVVNGDDVILILPLLIKAKQVITIEDILYEYRISLDSITSRFEMRKARDFFLSRTYMMTLCKSEGIWSLELEKEFYRMVYQITAYLLINCARSKKYFKEKKKFYSYVENQSIYRNSLHYKEQVKFPKRKKLSLDLFENHKYRLFTTYEELQNVFLFIRLIRKDASWK